MDKLPTYKISIDSTLAEDGEKLGMDMIAYTSTPAILTRGIAFDSVKPMRFTDALKYRLAAPILIPDLPIYRQDSELGEYNVVFDRETIEALYEDFMLNKGKAAFNLDHNNELISPSFILESWITGPSATDASFTKYGIELPEGSVFVVSQFTDKEYFQKEIIEKDRLGYSIEGFLGLALSTIKTNIKQKEMTKLKFAQARLEDGTAIYVSALEVGGEVKTVDENGTSVPLFDGEHILDSGETLVTVDGKITEVKPKAEEMAETPAEEAPVEAELAEEVIEEAPVEAAPAIDEAAVLAIIQPKLDELYKVIAEIKTLIESDVEEDVTEVEMTKKPVSLSAIFKAMNK